MPALHLVRHGPSQVDPATPPETWPLDPTRLGAIDEFARDTRLPADAVWFSSPEPKAVGTARRLTDDPVTVLPELVEHRRGVHWFERPEEFRAAVRAAFTDPDRAAVPEWEPLARTRARLLPVVRRLLETHADRELVLVGHGTAWTLLVAELTGDPPDLETWAALRMPDLWSLPLPLSAPV